MESPTFEHQWTFRGIQGHAEFLFRVLNNGYMGGVIIYGLYIGIMEKKMETTLNPKPI